MGTISLQVPVSGQPNSTEDPKIASDMTTIQTVINGNIDTNNVSPTAGITATQLAANTTICRVHRNAAYTHPGTGYVNIYADTVDFDPGSHYSVGTNLYTCPTTGYYQVNGQIRWTAGPPSGTSAIAVFKNGAITDEGCVTVGPAGGAGAAITVSSVVSCAATDTLNVAVFSTSNTATLVISAADNYMSVFRIT